MNFNQFVDLMSVSTTSTLARGLKDHLVVPNWKQFIKDVSIDQVEGDLVSEIARGKSEKRNIYLNLPGGGHF